MSLAINDFTDVATKAATDVATEGAHAARRLIDDGRTMAKNQVDASIAYVENEITTHPARALAIAGGLGFVIALLLMRRSG